MDYDSNVNKGMAHKRKQRPGPCNGGDGWLASGNKGKARDMAKQFVARTATKTTSTTKAMETATTTTATRHIDGIGGDGR